MPRRVRPALTILALLIAVSALSGTRETVAQCEVQRGAKLSASDATASDGFGYSLSVSGEVAVVGAFGDDCAAGLNCGSAYVYRFNPGVPGWVQEAKLTASDAASGDYFGYSVSVSGDVAVVGAYNDDCAAGFGCGSAYVYRFDGSAWVEQAKLTALDAAASDLFGYSVSVSVDTAVVATPLDDCGAGENCGAAYVYRFNPGAPGHWVQQAKLTASDPGKHDQFGHSVSVSGDTAVVGAYLDDCGAGQNCGAAYVYRFDGSDWIQQVKLTASDAAEWDIFGASVYVSGDVVLVGAPYADCTPGEACGAAYVYTFNGSTWVQQAKFTASVVALGGRFGWSVSVTGDTALIGTGAGSAYVFALVFPDCNMNGILDAADIPEGFSQDLNGNGIPDECEAPPPGVVVWNSDVLSPERTTRSLRFRVRTPATATGTPPQDAIKITMIDLQNPLPPNLPQNPPPDFSAYESATCTAVGESVPPSASGEGCCARWVGKPGTFLESQDSPGIGNYRAARLQCTPFYFDWITETTSSPITVVGAEIVPSSTYSVQTYGAFCKGSEAGCINVSPAVAMVTRDDGDISPTYHPPATSTSPDAIDVTALVNKFKNVPGAPIKPIAQLQPNLPELNADVNALDIVAVVEAVKQFAYPFSGPCPCPSTVTCGPAGGSVACAGPGVCVTAFGTGATCVETCSGGENAGDPCINNTHCPGGTCGAGFCRDRCGRCTP